MFSLQEKYQKKVIPAMQQAFGHGNVMAVPHITKVVVNAGVGRFSDEKQREEIQRYLALITGQRASARPTRKAIASFKTREGLIVGYQITLRGKRMYEFLSRLVDMALPRTRDFRGIPETSFDERGNLTIGIKEHIIFPEMIGEDYRFLFSFEVTIATSARTRKEGTELLRLMGFPIQKELTS